MRRCLILQEAVGEALQNAHGESFLHGYDLQWWRCGRIRLRVQLTTVKSSVIWSCKYGRKHGIWEKRGAGSLWPALVEILVRKVWFLSVRRLCQCFSDVAASFQVALLEASSERVLIGTFFVACPSCASMHAFCNACDKYICGIAANNCDVSSRPADSVQKNTVMKFLCSSSCDLGFADSSIKCPVLHTTTFCKCVLRFASPSRTAPPPYQEIRLLKHHTNHEIPPPERCAIVQVRLVQVWRRPRLNSSMSIVPILQYPTSGDGSSPSKGLVRGSSHSRSPCAHSPWSLSLTFLQQPPWTALGLFWHPSVLFHALCEA